MTGRERRAASDARGPAGSLQEDLASHLEECRATLLGRLHGELWEPLRESARRLGALRDEARASEHSLRDAGRAVRLLCDELEGREPAEELLSSLSVHLDEVAEFAHLVPRVMEDGGDRAEAGRLVPTRGTVRAVLEGDYPELLRSALDPGRLVLGPARALPPSPADLLREEDPSGELAASVDRAERHLRLALEAAAEGAVEEVRSLLRGGRPLDRLRLRWRRSRLAARRGAAEAALEALLEEADDRFRDLLEERRFTADLARRERALTEAAREAAEELEASAGSAEAVRALADRIEETGRATAASVAEGLGEGREPVVSRLEELESGILEAVDRVRARLPETDRPEADLTRSLGRFVQLSEALSGVGGEGDGGARSPEARRPAAIRDRVSRAVPRVRELTREAGGIVSHGLRAARSEAGVRNPDPEVVTGLVRESCERAARRLREGTDLLEGALDGAARAVREAPERLLAELRARHGPGREADGAPGWLEELRAAGRRTRNAARSLRRWWRRVGEGQPAASPLRAPAEAPEEPEGGFESLPAIYRWLFRPEPLDDPHLLKGRMREVARLRDLRRRWERGEPATLAVVGRPGAGKTSLLNCGAAELETGAAVRRGRVNRRLSGRAEAVEWLARFFGTDPGLRGTDDLVRALEDRREVVLLENAERLFRRQVGGYRAIRTLGELIEATAGRVAWVVTFDREPWRVLSTVTGVGGRFSDVMELAPLGLGELEEALLARHRLTGYDLRFVGEGEADERRERWFRRLWELSDGIPGRALQLWRASLVAAGDHEIRARRLRRSDPDRAGDLDREDLFVLGALIQHGDLPEADLPGLLHTPPDDVAERLGPLRRRGLIRPVPGLPPTAPLQVDRGAYPEVERRLRDAGLLVPEGEGP